MKLGATSPANKPTAERPAGAVALHDRRVAAGLTQTALARLSGIDQTAIAKVETGRLPLTGYLLAKLTAAIESVEGERP
jgi:transcriptional regulator with XRE-family HTH domain